MSALGTGLWCLGSETYTGLEPASVLTLPKITPDLCPGLYPDQYRIESHARGACSGPMRPRLAAMVTGVGAPRARRRPVGRGDVA